MRTADFEYELPSASIAQSPVPERDRSRLLVLSRDDGRVEHRQFRDILVYLRRGDVLVLNNSRVIPARLRGINAHTGGQFEVLLVEENAVNDWWVMLRPGRRARAGTQILFHDPHGNPSQVRGVVLANNDEGHRRLRFTCPSDITGLLDALGEVPLPPYINRVDGSQLEADRLRYQTVYAQPAGSVAAPTAGLHFTERLLDEIRSRGVQVCFLTLHVGLGTFAPVKAATIAGHRMHEERYELSQETAGIINQAKRTGRRVIAVGTTTVRVLETLAAEALHQDHSSPAPVVRAGTGKTRIFLYPPCDFRIADALLTNFHLPCSTLLMLVSAFATPKATRGCELVLAAYAEAIREGYRFFSYGDAMLIV